MDLQLIRQFLNNLIRGWETLKKQPLSVAQCYIRYGVPFALIAPVAAFIGTTKVGWPVGSQTILLTTDSALQMSIISFFAILFAILVMAKMIQWMGQTYQATQSLGTCVALATFTAMPLFIVGIAMLYPPLWFIYLIGLPALGYSVYLLYTGVPIMMEISPDRGFLFSSAILAVGLVSLVGLLVVTVSMWGIGFGPGYGLTNGS